MNVRSQTEVDLSLIERLAPEILGNIIGQLPNVTGRIGVLNNADVPVTMRYFLNFAGTSKTMYACVNDPYITKLFLLALAKKYKQSPEHFAATLNTVGARTLLWTYITDHQLVEAYATIQKVNLLASEVLNNAKEAGLLFTASQESSQTPNPYTGQTERGFFLYNDWTSQSLASPFGIIKIYNMTSYTAHGSLSVSEALIKRLNATFEKTLKTGGLFYEIPNPSDGIREIDDSELIELDEDDLKNKIGSKNLIVNSQNDNYPVYRFSQVDDIVLPEAKSCTKESARSDKQIAVIWEMLKRDCLGLDPLLKEEKPLTEEIIDPPLFTNISDVVPWAIRLIKELSEQEFFKEEARFNHLRKVLPLNSYREARALKQLTEFSKKFIDQKSSSKWCVSAFGTLNNKLFLNGCDIGGGIELFIDDKETCDFTDLAEAYEKTIMQLRQNWVLSNFRDYPDMLHNKSEEDYLLFIKKDADYYECELIMSLANLLGLSKFIMCNKSWNRDIGAGDRPAYLWIRKNKLEEVQKFFLPI